MAGAGAKLFQNGQKLFAEDVNEYLMDQTVMRFADAAARDAAFGGVGEPILAEGMMCYLIDIDELQKYTGSAWQNVIWNTAWGKWYYIEATTGTSFAGATDNLTTASFGVLSGRQYKITYYEPNSNISNNATTVTTLRNNTASTTLFSSRTQQMASQSTTIICKGLVTFSTGNLVLAGRNQSTVGGTTLTRDSTQRAFILVEDIGPV
jgi:hypothetical protein